MILIAKFDTLVLVPTTYITTPTKLIKKVNIFLVSTQCLIQNYNFPVIYNNLKYLSIHNKHKNGWNTILGDYSDIYSFVFSINPTLNKFIHQQTHYQHISNFIKNWSK